MTTEMFILAVFSGFILTVATVYLAPIYLMYRALPDEEESSPRWIPCADCGEEAMLKRSRGKYFCQACDEFKSAQLVAGNATNQEVTK